MRTFLVRLIRWIISVIRFLLPWIMRVVGWIVDLSTTSLASIWVGVPTAVRRIADSWVGEARSAGLPEKYDAWVFYPSTVVASITLLLGWVILAYITVFVISFVF